MPPALRTHGGLHTNRLMTKTRRLALPNLHMHVSGQTTTDRMWLLCSVAVLLGLIGGGAAVGLFKLIGLITHIVLLHNIGTSLPTLRGYHPSPMIIVTAVGGALLVSLLAAFSPVIRGHGIPESLETILVGESRISPRAALAKPLSAAITIGTGGPFGAEGPIIVTAGSLGSLIGQFLSTSPMERRIMLATGAAAGMAGTFNAPIASIILALELVTFERSLRTVIPLAIACGIAASIHMLAFGATPLFAIHDTLRFTLVQLPWYALVGLAAGVMAVVLSRGLFAAEAIWRRLPLKIFWWPLIGAVGFSSIGLLEPRSLSMGYSAISDTLNGRFMVGAIAALFIAKLFSWWISLSSQTSGGTLAPMFLVGATMGSMFGHGLDSVVPGLGIVPQAFALVAMGASFGAATKAPFTSVVFAFEVTGQYHMVIPLMIGVAAAELVAELFLSERIMTEKLSHRGFRVDFRTEVDPLRMRVVGQLMQAPITGTQRNQELSIGRVPAVGPKEYPVRALTLMIEHGVAEIPVVDAGQVVGRITRADIAAQRVRAYRDRETVQPGWGQALLTRARTGRQLATAGAALLTPTDDDIGLDPSRATETVGDGGALQP